ncbi:MAG: NFACT RNA binding domain-containing protein [Clostridiales Family XIII bacterium]|jgi:predicted ribosome quality control (RQC) complex YloA/Tae2 family protein|nr:NFACT RNA binding domain-containing protein [Clostridiales Family XIII bacterium]
MNKNRKLREKDFKNLITKNGLKILIGQNNIENDALTFRIADKDDLWFHIKDIPGSHIILRVTGKTPTDDDIMQAAEAAVYYSKARGQKGLPVDFVKVRKIKKIKGSYLGNVSFKENKSIIV